MNGAVPARPHSELAPELAIELPAVRWRLWAVFIVLALLFHAVLLFPKIPGLFSTPALAPAKVDIKQVDPRKLEEIRKQWRAREKALLLNKDKAPPTDTERPEDARYMSDRNIRVEKETRAKDGSVAKRGAPGAPSAPTRPRTQPKPRTRALPNLGALGVPLPMAPKELPRARNERPRERAGEDGANQAINDPNVPVGSENLLNAEESVYYSFYARLYESIGPIWQSKIRQTFGGLRLQPGAYSTQLDVVFDREGNLIAINLQGGSSVEAFDQASFAAWRAVGRFPNPPQGLLDARGEVHTGWTFTVQVSEGLNLRSLPPERVY